MKVVHCINLPKRTDRKESAEAQAKEQGFKINFWDGIETPKQPWIPHFSNISRAHKQIVRRAKEAGLNSILIMEDDCLFTHPDSFKYFIDSMPESYDLYMGLIYAGYIEGTRVKNGFSGGLTLYSIHSKFYDTFLSADEKDHIDRWCGGIAYNHDFFVCKPYVVIQKSNWYSDNMGRVMNYENYPANQELYTGK